MGKRKYNIIVLSHHDLSIGMSKYSRFADPHEVDPRAEDNGDDFFIQTQTARYIATGYRTDESRSLAFTDLSRIRPIRDAMNERFRESEINRLDGEVEYILKLDPLDQKFHLYNEEFQEFLPDMIRNYKGHLEKEGRGHEFNKAESDAILTMDRMLSNGEARSAMYTVSDSSGTVRYVNQFAVKNLGHITAQYIDIGKFVRDLEPSEAFDIIKNLGDKHGLEVETNALGQTYLVSLDKVLTSRQIHEVVIQKLIETDGVVSVERSLTNWESRQREHQKAAEQSVALRFITGVEQTLGDAGGRAIGDIRNTIAPIGTLLAAEFYHRMKKKKEDDSEEKPKKKDKKPSIVDRFKRIFAKESINKPSSVVVFEKAAKPKAKELLRPFPQNTENQLQKLFVFAVWLAPAAHEFGLAGPVLAMLAKPDRLKKTQQGEKKKNIKKRNELASRKLRSIDVKNVRERTITSTKGRDVLYRSTKENPKRQQRRRAERGLPAKRYEKRVQTEKVKRMSSEGRSVQKIREKQLVRVVALLIRGLHQDRLLDKLPKDRYRERIFQGKLRKPERFLLRSIAVEKRNQMREHVSLFSLAYSIWLLFRQNNSKSLRLSLDSIEIVPTILKKSKDEGLLVQTEGSSWILFAIIWYLAMIREQGKLSAQRKKSKRKKKYPRRKIKIQTRPFIYPDVSELPPRGVIYVSHS